MDFWLLHKKSDNLQIISSPESIRELKSQGNKLSET